MYAITLVRERGKDNLSCIIHARGVLYGEADRLKHSMLFCTLTVTDDRQFSLISNVYIVSCPINYLVEYPYVTRVNYVLFRDGDSSRLKSFEAIC